MDASWCMNAAFIHHDYKLHSPLMHSAAIKGLKRMVYFPLGTIHCEISGYHRPTLRFHVTWPSEWQVVGFNGRGYSWTRILLQIVFFVVLLFKDVYLHIYSGELRPSYILPMMDCSHKPQRVAQCFNASCPWSSWCMNAALTRNSHHADPMGLLSKGRNDTPMQHRRVTRRGCICVSWRQMSSFSNMRP